MSGHPNPPPSKLPYVILVSVQLPEVEDFEHEESMAELSRLTTTLGYQTAHIISQKKNALDPASVIGDGKVQELAKLIETDPHEIALVVFDHDLSPRQMRILEEHTKTEILDRRGVIVEIFYRHAKTREAKLQVEIARLNYAAPRLREKHKGQSDSESRLGESGVELDKRRLRDRIAELKKELAQIGKMEVLKRKRREESQTVALVGYTNAGKSSLMRALTADQIYVADKLFATLDTKVRALSPATTPPIYIIDTVGFIKKLPHDLVASFRSTLEEAKEAALLIFVVDASDPSFRVQLATTQEVLGEMGILEGPQMLLLNKIDKVEEKDRQALKVEFPQALQLSAHQLADVAQLRSEIIKSFEKSMKEVELSIPFDQGGLLAEIHREAHVVTEAHHEEGTTIVIRAPQSITEKLLKKVRALSKSRAR